MHVSELARHGADIEIEGPTAIVREGSRSAAPPVMASDLRASAALVVAGSPPAAEPRTSAGFYHLDRGYENIDGKPPATRGARQRIEET